MLKKSPTVLYGALSLGWAPSEKQPAAPPMDELWKLWEAFGRRVESYGTGNSRVRHYSRAVVLLQLALGTV